MGPRVLLVAHSESRENRVAALLQAKGCILDWRCPRAGDRLPADGRGYAGAVVFGGAQSVNDAPKAAYLQHEIDWIGEHVRAGRPFLGICLGAQLLARALGAPVERHAAGLHEIGYYPVTATPAGQGLFPARLQVYHWHREGFALPAGAELLATGDGFANQAYRYGATAYGLQFHPEVTPSMLRRWLESEGAEEDLGRPGAQEAALHLAGCAQFDPALGAWADGFLDHWLAAPARGAPAARPEPASAVARDGRQAYFAF
jgi:GMP synthase (glutamine-hydrolysing)